MKLPSNTSHEEVPDWQKADFVKLREILGEIDWGEEFLDKSTAEMWTIFEQKLNSAQLSCVPKKRRRVSNKPIWMNLNVLRVIRKKRRLW